MPRTVPGKKPDAGFSLISNAIANMGLHSSTCSSMTLLQTDPQVELQAAFMPIVYRLVLEWLIPHGRVADKGLCGK